MAIPSRVLRIDGLAALVDTAGQTRQVSLALLEPGSVVVGDYVLVQLGQFAYERLDEAQALESLALFAEVDAALDAGELHWG